MQPPSPTATQMAEGELVGGRYRLLRRIGAGAMGTVWAAQHELLGREFAIKLALMPSKTAADARRRFLQEAQIAAKLRHPNIVDVADFGETAEGRGLYLAMELLSGESLAEHISMHGPLHASEAVAIAIEVCRGLEAAHAIGVVHRDIKPENIFLARGSSGGIVPKLLDFGICKKNIPGDPLASQSNQSFGTPAYMSPEQAVGESDIDHATDIWAMGVVLFEMVTAAHPFVAPGYHALLARIADDPPAPLPPRVAEPLRRVIDRCLQKRRADRYGDAGALRRALEETFASIDIAHAGGLVIESARVLSSASRDSSGHALAVASPPAKAPPRRAIHKHWAFIGVVSLCAVAASVLTWRQLARVPDDSALVPSAPASPPPQAQPATTAVVAPATLTTPASTGDPAPSAAPSSARATSQKARSPAKPVKKTTSRSTHVDGPGF